MTSRFAEPEFDVVAAQILDGAAGAPIVLTCEHASERFPDPWRLPDADRWLAGTHWAYDLGAAELARELAEILSAPAVLADFSRLIVDPNRDERSASLFLEAAQGRAVILNEALDPAERALRLERLHRPYHAAVDRAVGASSAPTVLAIHTFTPVWQGEPRAVEVGVLFDREEAMAQELAARLDSAGFHVRLNEPYSGRAGLIYSAERHAAAHGRRALELELRQDLAVDPRIRSRVAACVAAHFTG